MQLATVQTDSPQTRYCVGCQTARAAEEFATPQSLRCKACVGQKISSGQKRFRAEVQERAANKLLEMVIREPENVLTRSENAKAIKRRLGGQEAINVLYADKLLEVLQGDSINGKIKGLLALRALDADEDASKSQLQNGLKQLSDEELAQLGMALLTRALAADGNLELLSELADQCGYTLVPKELAIVEGTAEVACA